MNISAIIKTKNSENTLCSTLEAIKGLDDIIIIDENSSDDTVEIAHEYKARVIYSLPFEFETAFNQALFEAKNEWVLSLEADEIVPNYTLEQIEKYFKNEKKNKNALLFNTKTFYLNSEVKSLRKREVKLFKKGQQKLFPYKIKGDILKYVEGDILKKTKDILLEAKIEAKIEAKADILKPIKTFLYFYFIKGAYKDSLGGLVFAYLKAQKDFLVQTILLEKEEKNDI